MFEPTSFNGSGLAIHPFPPFAIQKKMLFSVSGKCKNAVQWVLFLFAFSESAQDLLAYCAFFAEYAVSLKAKKKQKNTNHPTTQPPNHPTTQPPSQQPNQKKKHH